MSGEHSYDTKEPSTHYATRFSTSDCSRTIRPTSSAMRGELERLLSDYRTFLTPLDFPTDHEQQRQQTVLLQRTRGLLGEEQASPHQKDPDVPQKSGLYLFEVD